MLRSFMVLLGLVAITTSIKAATIEKGFYQYDRSTSLHYGVYKPSGEVVGDILFLHGFGDTFENHGKLFKEWNDKGFRVISFDFPSHGKTETSWFGDLDFVSFTNLANMAYHIQILTYESKRPLLVAGWSTGGLLAIRMLQVLKTKIFARNASGLILYAPGVSVKKCVGENFCEITNETLTHNESLHSREIKPRFPALKAGFASKLLLNAHQSWKSGFDRNLPVLTFVGSIKGDKYVKSKNVIKWVKKQREKFQSKITAFHCKDARHELDNEPAEFGGDQVRSLSVAFAKNIVEKNNQTKAISGPCEAF